MSTVESVMTIGGTGTVELTVKAVSAFKVFPDSEPHAAFVSLEVWAFGLRTSLNLSPNEALALAGMLAKAGNEAPGLPTEEMNRARPAAAPEGP